MKNVLQAVAVALAVGTSTAVIAAEDKTSGLHGQITPYVWATGLGGEIRPFAGAPTVAVNKSFSELLSDLDAAFFISGLLRKDRFVLLADVSTSISSREGMLPSPPAPAPLPATGRLRQTSATLAGGYRVAATDAVTLDLLAGLRIWDVRATATVPPVAAIGFPGAGGSAGRGFVDPIIAGRVNANLASSVSALVYADIGGFGAGSDHTLQLLGTLNWQVSQRVALSAGYRHLEMDYRKRGSLIDMAMSGPLLGVTIGF
jgi:hypothetical protein